jgi:protein N-terminal amidase
MDLNPQIRDWQREDGPYELASHCLSNRANLLILLNAWLDSKEEPEEAHDWRTLNYWAGRLRPLWTDENSEVATAEPSSTRKDDKHSGRETVVVICNRTGEENG